MLNNKEIENLREKFKTLLNDYNKSEKIKLEIPKEILENLIFMVNKKNYFKYPALDFELIKKLDLTDISFDGVNVSGLDFTGSKGVKINPQTIWEKKLGGTKLNNVEIVGSFDDVIIINTDFTGCIGAKIDPQTVWKKVLAGTILNGCEIDGSFEGVCVQKTDFTGSTGAKIDPQTIADKSLNGSKLANVEFVGTFDDVDVREADFTGSVGAQIDPRKVWNKSLDGTNLTDVTIIENEYDKIYKQLVKAFKK